MIWFSFTEFSKFTLAGQPVPRVLYQDVLAAKSTPLALAYYFYLTA
jgi:hypothetical protein